MDTIDECSTFTTDEADSSSSASVLRDESDDVQQHQQELIGQEKEMNDNNEEEGQEQEEEELLLLDENIKITILCEIIGASHLSRDNIMMNDYSNNSSNKNDIEPYCTVQFYSHDQNNASKDKNKDNLIHHTKRAKQCGSSPIWTISTGSLFLLKNISINEMVHNDLYINIYHKQEDALMLSTLQTICLGKTRISFLNQILPNLNEQRIDSKLYDEHYNYNHNHHNDNNNGLNNNKGTLTCRFRLATPSDIRFLSLLQNQPELLKTTSILTSSPVETTKEGMKNILSHKHQQEQSSRFLQLRNHDDENTTATANKLEQEQEQSSIKKTLKKKHLLVTETNETEKVTESFFNAISSVFTSKVKHDSNTGCTKIHVKPYPDPDRITDTSYMTKHELKYETLLPSKEWIYAGSGHNIGGKVYLEILSCHNLPNIDIGEAIGNYTDCFICAVLEDAVIQTDVINDELNPLWLPWTQRAFIFGIKHPSSHLYIGAFDYDLGISPHEPIGRIAINISHFQSNTDYTLKYHLYPSSNVTERNSVGSITIRLRVEYNNEKDILLSAIRNSSNNNKHGSNSLSNMNNKKFHVNVHKEKSLAVVRYTCFGSYGDDSDQTFDMTVARSYLNEIFEYKAAIYDSVCDALCSLILWRGQVQIFRSNTYIPLHSFFFFCAMTILIERPYLLPSFLCISIGWILIATQTVRRQHPSPWYRCPSLWHYLEILRTGKAPTMYRSIRCYEGAKEADIYEKQIQDRLERDVKKAAQQAILEQKIAELGDDNIHTKVLPNGISLDLYVRLSRYQGIMGRYCRQLRAIKLIVLWEDSIMSFWITFCFISGGLISLLLPWKFILIWSSRIIVWGLFGPQMKIVDWLLFSSKTKDNNNSNDNELEQMMNKFHSESQNARIRRQDALKIRDMKCLAFGKYITRVPLGNVCRHYDRPLPESFATTTTNSDGVERKIADQCIPGQQYYGANILPRTEHEMLVFDNEMKELQPLYETLCNTAKMLHDNETNQLIQRLKSQTSLNDDIPESEGYELVSYDHNNNNNDTNNRRSSISNSAEQEQQETRLQLGNGSTLSLNLKSSKVAIIHNEENEGSRRRRTSTFRGGFEMLPVIRDDDDDDDEDANDDDINDKPLRRKSHQRSTKKSGMRIKLGSSLNRLVIDSSERVAILDTNLQNNIDAATTTTLTQTTMITQTTMTKTTLTTNNNDPPFNDVVIPKRSYDKLDPLQRLAKRSVSSIIHENNDEERESGDIEIVLCPTTIREESVELDADYENEHDGDLQSVMGGYDNNIIANNNNDDDENLTTDSSINQSSVVYFKPT